MYTPEQIRVAGTQGEINSIDVEHLIEILEEKYRNNARFADRNNDDENDYGDDYDDWEDDDEEDPLGSIAEQCTCGAYQWVKGRWMHVSDCIC